MELGLNELLKGEYKMEEKSYEQGCEEDITYVNFLNSINGEECINAYWGRFKDKKSLYQN
jgi:hypothetical protein